MRLIDAFRRCVSGLYRQVTVVYFASRDHRMPFWLALVAMAVAAYALSPVDLIPDFIPVLGLIDDFILVPLGLALIIRFTPAVVIQDASEKQKKFSARPSTTSVVVAIFTIWAGCAVLGGWLLYRVIS